MCIPSHLKATQSEALATGETGAKLIRICDRRSDSYNRNHRVDVVHAWGDRYRAAYCRRGIWVGRRPTRHLRQEMASQLS